MADQNIHMQQWLADAQKQEVDGNPLSLPYDVFLAEVRAFIDLVGKYWEPDGARPGLKGVASRLPTADDLRSKLRAVQEAQTELLLIVDPLVVDKGERARFLVDELESVAEFVLDDDVQETADERLAQIKAFHSQDGQRSSALSQLLRDYAALCRDLGDRIKAEDKNFDLALVDEAAALSTELANAPTKAPSTASTAATKLRNQFLALLIGDLSRGRQIARHTFRRHPEILREVGSAYERRRRAANRRAKAATDAAKPPQNPA